MRKAAQKPVQLGKIGSNGVAYYLGSYLIGFYRVGFLEMVRLAEFAPTCHIPGLATDEDSFTQPHPSELKYPPTTIPDEDSIRLDTNFNVRVFEPSNKQITNLKQEGHAIVRVEYYIRAARFALSPSW